VVSPLLSNILLTPFDQEMRRKGYQLTRYADDWVITCKSAVEARVALAAALRILERLGVRLNPEKTRIVHVRFGFWFLGYQIKRGRRRQLANRMLGRTTLEGLLYAYPRKKSIRRFKGQVRQLTSRRAPVTTQELIDELNPKLRGWGHYYQRAHVRRLFTQLDAWIVRRIGRTDARAGAAAGGNSLPQTKLYGEMGLVNLLALHLRARPPVRESL
jgi:RNA-directed DNA polymerase